MPFDWASYAVTHPAPYAHAVSVGRVPGVSAPAPAVPPTTETKKVVTGEQLKEMTTKEFQDFYEKREEYVVIPTEEALQKSGKTLKQWSEEAGYTPESVAAARKEVLEQIAEREAAKAPPKTMPIQPAIVKPPAMPTAQITREIPAAPEVPVGVSPEVLLREEGFIFEPLPTFPPTIPPAYEPVAVRPEFKEEPPKLMPVPPAYEPVVKVKEYPMLGTISVKTLKAREEAAKEERKFLETWIAPMPGDPFYTQIGKGLVTAVGGPIIMAGEISRTVHTPKFQAEFGKAPLPTLGKQLYGFGAGFVEMGIKYPIYTATTFLAPTLAKYGLRKVGIMKPTYKVTYLKSVIMGREWRGIEAFWMKRATAKPIGRTIIGYKPPPKISLTHLFPKEFIKKGKPIPKSLAEMKIDILIGKGFEAFRKKVYVERIKPITFKGIVKGKKPKIPETLTAVSVKITKGFGIKDIMGKRFIRTAALRREMEMLVPIKIPKTKTAIVKVAPPKLPPMKPFKFTVPSYKAISPGAAARADLLMKGFEIPSKLAKVKPKAKIRIITKPIPISVKEMRQFAPYEYISPTAAGIVGIKEPPMIIERQRLVMPSTPVYINEQRQLQRSLSKLMPKLKPKLRLKEKLRLKPEIKPMVAQMKIPIPRMGLITMVTPKVREKPKLLLKLKERPRLMERFAPIDIKPIRGPAMPGRGLSLPIPFPKEEFFPRFRRRKKRLFPRQPKKYRPSLVGIVSGKTIERELQKMTGFGIRFPVKKKGKRKKKSKSLFKF